jgi:hypothetical protein
MPVYRRGIEDRDGTCATCVYLPRANGASPVWLGELRSPARGDSELHTRARCGKGVDTPSGSHITHARTHARTHRCGYAGREPVASMSLTEESCSPSGDGQGRADESGAPERNRESRPTICPCLCRADATPASTPAPVRVILDKPTNPTQHAPSASTYSACRRSMLK